MDATNWHSDLNMAPLDTNDMLTAWIPIHDLGGAQGGGWGGGAGGSPPPAPAFWGCRVCEVYIGLKCSLLLKTN